MLAWHLCDFDGIWTSIAKKSYIFVIFQGGPRDPHMMKSKVNPDQPGFIYWYTVREYKIFEVMNKVHFLN